MIAVSLADFIKQRGMNQAELAEVLHTTPATVSRWLSARRHMTLEQVAKVGQILNVDILIRDGQMYCLDRKWDQAEEALKPSELSAFLGKLRELLKGNGLTPSDYRVRKGLLIEHLALAVRDRKISMSVEQLRRYERGDVKNLDDPRCVIRMQAISSVLGVHVNEYRAAVRSLM